jgi:ABC-type dipeptide/oligopeptide/nickel transport system permease subunit
VYVLAAAVSLSTFGLVFFAVVFAAYMAGRVRGSFQRLRSRPRVSRSERERTRELIAARLAREVGGTISVALASDAGQLSSTEAGTCPKCAAPRLPGFFFCRTCGYRWNGARTTAEAEARPAPSPVMADTDARGGRVGQRPSWRVRLELAAASIAGTVGVIGSTFGLYAASHATFANTEILVLWTLTLATSSLALLASLVATVRWSRHREVA